MTDVERNKYLEAYYNNEANANKHMSYALLFTAVLLSIIWIGYFAGIFNVTDETLIVTHIVIAVSLCILVSPMFYIKTKKIRKPGFKYFVLFSFLFVIAILNIVIPKHIIIGWAVCIVLTNHYYNPKVGKIVFVFTTVLLLLCIYAGMFVGEFDSNLLSGELDAKEGIIHNYMLTDTYSDSPVGRFEYLHNLIAVGDNRYLKAFIYYYIPRLALITILFFVSNALNKRTYNLLVSEIQVNSEQQKTKTELEVAKDIQLATLPSEISTSEDIEIVGELKAAKEVGGDFYDYFDIDDNHVAMVIGDVSGKGIPAAMFMMKTITCFKNFTRANKTPAEILMEVNASIYEGNHSQMFVTCFLAILDKSSGVLKFANAGHNPPIIGSNRHFRYLKCNTGFVLGGLKDAFVIDEEITLKPGECLTLYTDGITEARNSDGDFFGEERLIQTFNKKDYTCLVELHHSIKDEVVNFEGDAPQSDDITFITLKYHGDKYSYSESIFNATIDNLPAMLDFIKRFCTEHKFQNEFCSNLLVVADELISNVAKYGYENKGGELFIRLLFNEDQKEFVLTVIDKAPAFNQLEVNNSIVGDNVQEQKVGGLGILIVKKIMSEYAYDRINGKNILVLRKKFN